jgi:hypothetical protein
MTRQLTDSERSTLALHAAFALSFGRFLAPSIGRALLTLLAAFLLLGVPLAVAKVDFSSWPVKDLIALGVAGTFIFWIAIAMRDYWRKRRELAPRQEALRVDLAAGVAEIERRVATGAIRALGPVHGERCYFMRLDDGRVMFVGYWNPPDGDPGALGPEGDGFPSTEFEIARAPRSQLVLGVTGKGIPLEPSETFTLNRRRVDEDRLPESGKVVDVPWESIVRAFGPEI